MWYRMKTVFDSGVRHTLELGRGQTVVRESTPKVRHLEVCISYTPTYAPLLSLQCATARAWLVDYASKNGDYMPDDGTILLPPGTRHQVYERFYEEVTEHRCTERYFNKVWLKYCFAIRQRKKSRFGNCNDCAAFDMAIKQETGETRLRLCELKQAHLIQQREERNEYYIHKQMSRSYPKKCITIIVDGMDSSKLELPKLQVFAKDIDAKHAIRFSLMGVKIQSAGDPMLHLFLNSGRFIKNANGTMNALFSALFYLKTMMGELAEEGYIQLDNCPSENKSKAIYFLFALMVALGMFKAVYVNYLLVGHTHEDIDQVFSMLSLWLSHRDTWTPLDLLTVSPNACVRLHSCV
jgi:hypothetical protein